MRIRQWLVCGSAVGVVLAIAIEGCSSPSSSYPQNVCGSPESCSKALAPSPAEIDSCTKLLEEPTCGSAYSTMRECEKFRAVCTSSGSVDRSKTETGCAPEITAYRQCKSTQPQDAGPDGCRQRTCSQMNASCGEIDDGCGGKLSCGTCSNGQTCGSTQPNRCGCACDPTWCGMVTACGTTITCPTNCPATQTCGGGGVPNRCGCLPSGATAKSYAMSVSTSAFTLDGGTPTAWNNATNARLSDNSYAYATLVTGSVTQYLVALNFGITLPANAIVDGIEVVVERNSTQGLATTDAAVYLVKNTAVQTAAANKADLALVWPSAESPVTYGGANDKWGNTWTAADLNAGFGVAFAARYTGMTGTEQARVDSIGVIVHYSGIVCQ
jgi:hypothetical protein